MRLLITLPYLATRATLWVLDGFRIPCPSISKIVLKTAKATWNVLQPECLKCSTTEVKWLQIAHGELIQVETRGKLSVDVEFLSAVKFGRQKTQVETTFECAIFAWQRQNGEGTAAFLQD